MASLEQPYGPGSMLERVLPPPLSTLVENSTILILSLWDQSVMTACVIRNIFPSSGSTYCPELAFIFVINPQSQT